MLFLFKNSDYIHREIIKKIEKHVSVKEIFTGKINIAYGCTDAEKITGNFTFSGKHGVTDAANC